MRLRSTPRRGSIIPTVVVSLVALLGFIALAIDIGVMLVARTQCQLAVDSASMAGARTLNGDVANNNNYANAGPNAIAAATACEILSTRVKPEWINTEIGYYTYDRANQRFGVILPSEGGTLPSNENWSLVKAELQFDCPAFFGKIFGPSAFQINAESTAVHRPRDVCIIMDFSGSMSFDSLLGGTYSGTRTKSLNPEDVYPKFGHHSAFNPTASSGMMLSSGEILGTSNITVDTHAGTALVNDYYQHELGGTPVPAFSPAPDGYATEPEGDIPLKKNRNSSTSWAASVKDVLGTTSRDSGWETNGYSDPSLNGGVSKPFAGYTVGPRYWGKTFFVWPPDPRPQHDWRRKFFFKSNGTTPLDDNSLMWTTGTSPKLKSPRTSSTTNYYINYAAILRWLTTTGPNPFPPRLRAGAISYYTRIPDASNPANDSALNTRFRQTNPTDLNERFWKHYIDFVLGVQQTGSGPVYTLIADDVGYGDDFNWGSLSISAKPSGSDTRYMNYNDNPPRPKTRLWFGPMTLLDFLDNYNQDRRWCPGTVHQAPLWGCKIGMRATMLDIQKNHPNDYVALSFFNTPEYSPGDGGKFNRVRAPLGRNYSRMVDSLFFPQITLDDPVNYPEINCYNAAQMREVPRASGGTCPAMSFMHAYNQFSSNSSLINYNPSPAPPGDAGGLGRKGAQKMIIFMTDGVANTPAHASFTNQGPYQSYYRIRIPGEYPSNSTGSHGSVENQLYAIANQICALDTASSPGYSTARKPALIHSVAFGGLFDPSATSQASASRDLALRILQRVQYIGKTQSDPNTPLQSYKIITGSTEERIQRLQMAFQRIMQDSVSVTLID